MFPKTIVTMALLHEAIIWRSNPYLVIYTAAVAMLKGMVEPENCRTEAILADAAHVILTRDSRGCTDNFSSTKTCSPRWASTISTAMPFNPGHRSRRIFFPTEAGRSVDLKTPPTPS
jgi:hypothetical protein